MNDDHNNRQTIDLILRFDLPYPLHVGGDFHAKVQGNIVFVELSTVHEENGRLPGIEEARNASLKIEDNNLLARTHVTARFDSLEQSILENIRLFRDVPALAQELANLLVTAARKAHGDYILDYIHQSWRLGPIRFQVASGVSPYPEGVIDGLMGGVTSRKPTRTNNEASAFAAVLAQGEGPTVAEELYFDAKRYLTLGNRRMALANLAIGFEVALADLITEAAARSGDQSLAAEAPNATLGSLGTGLAKRAFGFSLEAGTADGRIPAAFRWICKARNGVLHKGLMIFTVDSVTRDFNDLAELIWLFEERDWLLVTLAETIAPQVESLKLLLANKSH